MNSCKLSIQSQSIYVSYSLYRLLDYSLDEYINLKELYLINLNEIIVI